MASWSIQLTQDIFEWPWRLILSRLPWPFAAVNLGMLAYVLGFLGKWTLVWLILDQWEPGWLPGVSAIETAAEVLPALMVSIFVFLFGSLFVVIQQATSIHSNRASLLLIYDHSVQQIVVRALVVATATLILALAVPNEVASTAVGAFTVVLVAATVFTLT